MNPRKAILTGSIKYIESPLSYPEKDVKLINSTLKKRCSFNEEDIKTILIKDGIEDSFFIERIKEICAELELKRTNTYDLILFYFSGHGVYSNAEHSSFLQISDTYLVSIDEVISIISSVNAKNKYFIIDACQSGGFTLMRPKSKIERQYSYNSEGIYCMFGTTKNLLAFEPTLNDVIRRKIKNSFYTHFIAEALDTKSMYNEGTISIKVVDDYASKKTPTYTNFEQIPFSTTVSTGYFPLGQWDETPEFSDIDEWQSSNFSADYALNQEIDTINYLVEKVQNLYANEESLFFIPDIELLPKLSQPAKDLLNDRLGLIHKKFEEKPLINGLITTARSDKRRFLIFVLEHKEIQVDLTLIDSSGKTALFDAIYNSMFSSQYIIQLLFIRGYYLNTEEHQFLVTQFNQNSIQPEILENITVALICHKLKSPDLILKFRKIEKIIFTILSFKTGKIISYKLNHLALANNFLNSHKEFSTIFLKGLKKYNYYEAFGLKPTFLKKVKVINDELPFQENQYDEVLKFIFPELFD